MAKSKLRARANLHFEANADEHGRVPNIDDIHNQLREEFPDRKFGDDYTKSAHQQWRHAFNPR